MQTQQSQAQKSTLTKSQISPQFTFSLDTPSLSASTLEGYLKNILGTDSVNSFPDMFVSSCDFKPLNSPNNSSGNLSINNTSSSSSSSKEAQQQQQLFQNHSHEQGGIKEFSLSGGTSSSSLDQGAPPVVVSISSSPTEKRMDVHSHTSRLSSSQHHTSSSSSHHPSELPSVREISPLTTSVVSGQHTDNGMQVALPRDLTSGAMIATDTATELIPMPRGQAYVDITEYLNMPQAEAAKKLGIPASTLSKRWKEAVRKRKWPYRMICKVDKEIMTLLHNVPQGPNAPPLPAEIETALGHLLRKRQEELRSVVIRL